MKKMFCTVVMICSSAWSQESVFVNKWAPVCPNISGKYRCDHGKATEPI
jgi:hypothetical protein